MTSRLPTTSLGALALASILLLPAYAQQPPAPAPQPPAATPAPAAPADPPAATPAPGGPGPAAEPGPRRRGPPGPRAPGGPAGMGPGMMMGPAMMGRGYMARMCDPGSAGFAQWRIERLERTLKPTEQQKSAFDELKQASTKAAETVKAACPSEMPLTPTGQLELMEKHLTTMLEAVKTIRPAFENFYKTLSDEQKARLVAAGPGRGWRWEREERDPDDRRHRWRDRW